jgi:hypothetical protein
MRYSFSKASFMPSNTPCLINDCNSLSNINTFVEQLYFSSGASWEIGSGKKDSGFALTQSCYGGYIEFLASLNSKAKMTFWTKSENSSYSSIIPEVTIDGVLTNPAENRRTEFKVISTGNDKVKVTNTSTDSFDGK